MGSLGMPQTDSDSEDNAGNAQNAQEEKVQDTESEAASETTPEAAPEAKPEEPKEADTSGDNPDTQNVAFEADQLASWIKEKIEGTDISISRKERKEWENVAEEHFALVWKKALTTAIDECCFLAVNLEGTEKILSNAITLYTEMYDNAENVSDLSKLSEELHTYLQANKKLNAKYSFQLNGSYNSYTESEFYITQRLETNYSDNILGKLHKELDSYKPQTTSDWVAYNVDYSLGTATRGDTCSVIHSDSLHPFPESGAYYIAYVDTGTTTELTNIKGFTKTVPVYQMIDVATLEADQAMYDENNNNAVACYQKICQALA